MREILIIIKKELKELLRDKKTIFNSIILPTLITPILIIGISKVTSFINKKESRKAIEIGLVNAPDDFLRLIANDTLNKTTNYQATDDFKNLIDEETIQTAIVFPSDWDSQMSNLNTSEIKVYRNGTKDNVNDRVSALITSYNNTIKEYRIKALDIPVQKMTPFKETYVEVGERKELIGKRIGGFIPYIFILSLWGGCVLSAIDLVTGEKERKTIETTLSLPISKFKILLGKAAVSSLLGFLPALFNIVGIIIGVKLLDNIPPAIQTLIDEFLSVQNLTLILLLLIPFAIFISALLIALITGATSFKEAQSKVTPVIMFIIIPLVLAMLPTMELSWATVFIPVLNIGLGIKDVMAGTIDMAQYATILVSMIAIAVGAIFFSYKKFSDENAILK
ncbi:ABC transporter permease [Flavobacteriaceae bacterium R38]|nr:ABC transporter permease [Flavobacteriaceae bacterium R38]